MRSSKSSRPAVASPPSFLTVPGLDGEEFVHRFSTLAVGSVDQRPGREAAGREARRRLAEEAGLELDAVAFMGAVHGAHAAHVTAPGLVEDVDALLTDVRGLGLFATYGDCHPIVAYDPDRPAVGLAHAGWRGTVAGVGPELVRALQREFGSSPQRLHVGLGPGVCGHCYEVGEDVAARFPAAVRQPAASGAWWLDVGAANRLALLEAGIRPDHLHVLELCTRETEWLPSHRRDHDGRRFGALVALR